jgi:hypothetical protein
LTCFSFFRACCAGTGLNRKFPTINRFENGETIVNFGVIGYGYWGPNVVRNLASLEGSHVIAIAEVSPAARLRAQKAYPGVKVTANTEEVISSAEIDAIAVVTPVWTHYELVKAALENGKHVFVEKPFTSNAAQGEELINLAQQKNLKIMVDPHLRDCDYVGTLKARQVPHDVRSPVPVSNHTEVHDCFTVLKSFCCWEFAITAKANAACFGKAAAGSSEIDGLAEARMLHRAFALNYR